MIQGTIEWTSRSKEFGLVTPDSGGRNVFVRLSTSVTSFYISDGQGGPVVTDAIAKAETRHQVASRVEVRTRYQRGQWASGYEIAQVVESGYRLRRPGASEILPDIFVPAEVRLADD